MITKKTIHYDTNNNQNRYHYSDCEQTHQNPSNF